MKRITVKYTIEIPEDRLDKYCFKTSLTRSAAKHNIKIMAEVYGRTYAYGRVEEIINSKEI